MPMSIKAKGRCDLGGSAALHETHFQKKGSKMNVTEQTEKGNTQLRDAMLDQVEILIASAIPILGKPEKFAVVPKAHLLSALRAMDAYVIGEFA